MDFKKMKLGKKLGLGFGVVLVLALIANLIGLIGFVKVLDRLDKGEEAKEIVEQVLEMRRHEKDYIIRKKDEYITEVNNRVNNILDVANNSIQKNNSENKKIVESIGLYKESFDMYVKIEEQKSLALNVMRESGDIVVNDLNNLQKNLLTAQNNDKYLTEKIVLVNSSLQLFLELRKAEKDIIIFGDKSYFDKHMQLYDETNNRLTELINKLKDSENLDLARNVLTDTRKYKNTFDVFCKSTNDQIDDTERMVKYAGEVIELSETNDKYQTVQMFNEISNARLVLRIFTALAIILGVIIAIVLTKGITRRLGGEPYEVEVIANKIANGDLMIDFGNEKRIGVMHDIQLMVEKLKEIVKGITDGAENIAAASQEISSASQQMSQGANEQASSSEEVSSSMEEIGSNIQQNTDNAQETEKIARLSAEGIKKGNDSAAIAVNSMNEIAEKITIVNDIAFQTNILALNAAVEAARAGEHGRGFAVVAAEVRGLAERSKTAADEIEILLKHGVEVSTEAGSKLSAVVPEIEKTAQLVQEITASSMEQNSGVEQVNSAIQQLNQVTQHNAAASEEMATSSEELASQAEQLKETVLYFKIDEESLVIEGKTERVKRNLNSLNKEKIPIKLETFNVSDQEFENF
jgi:methyl-accepting chemotaxis protein